MRPAAFLPPGRNHGRLRISDPQHHHRHARPRGKSLIAPSISIEPAFPLLMYAPPRYAKGVSILGDQEGGYDEVVRMPAATTRKEQVSH
jgi:hypothetical protein